MKIVLLDHKSLYFFWKLVNKIFEANTYVNGML